jgi:hypothetical protein
MELQLSYFFVIPSAKRSYVGVVEGLPLSRSSWSLSAVYQHRSSAATPKIKKKIKISTDDFPTYCFIWILRCILTENKLTLLSN